MQMYLSIITYASSSFQKNHHPVDDGVGYNPDVLRRAHKVSGRPRIGRVQHVHDRLDHRIPGRDVGRLHPGHVRPKVDVVHRRHRLGPVQHVRRPRPHRGPRLRLVRHLQPSLHQRGVEHRASIRRRTLANRRTGRGSGVYTRDGLRNLDIQPLHRLLREDYVQHAHDHTGNIVLLRRDHVPFPTRNPDGTVAPIVGGKDIFLEIYFLS